VILQEIIEHKRDEIAGRMEETPLEDMRRQAESAPPVMPCGWKYRGGGAPRFAPQNPCRMPHPFRVSSRR